MEIDNSQQVREAIDSVFRAEGPRVLSTLIRLLGDFNTAEDAMQDALAAALQRWPTTGIPQNPRAWLVAAGRFKGIDAIRRASMTSSALDLVGSFPDPDTSAFDNAEDESIDDDLLRLIFTCCHPVLSNEAQVALTLREVCGLTTEEIARAFLASPTTLAQRIVRAKSKIRESKVSYEVPQLSELPERLQNVLKVAYLVYNEGYYSTSGQSVTRQALSSQGIRLCRLLADLLPEPEVLGLLALMLLQESRRLARTTASGDLILLADQDRTLWNRALMAEGAELVREALEKGYPGQYTIQAAIASVHTAAQSAEQTNWARIIELYDMLYSFNPSPVVALNRAVAVAMNDAPESGLALIDELLQQGDLKDYGLAHSARAELCRRTGRLEDARTSYQRALDLATQEPEKRFLRKRLEELGS